MERNCSIFCVDDEAKTLAALRRTLFQMRSSHEVRFFSDGRACLKALEPGGDLVMICDWMMPGVDGLAMCKAVREWELQHEDFSAYFLFLSGRGDVEDVVEALDFGADDFLTKPVESRELLARIRVGLRSLALRNRLRLANEELRRYAYKDAVTGLMTRMRGEEVLHEHLEMVTRGREDLALLLIDLDHFKTINDTHGHDVGDRVLRHIADLIRNVVRAYDAVVRWGGDEMLVICPQTGFHELSALAKRIHETVRASRLSFDRGTIAPTLSIGGAAVSKGFCVDTPSLVAAADSALYAVKHRGRDGYECRDWAETLCSA